MANYWMWRVNSDKNIIEKAGSWYTYNKQRLGQGREAAKTFLKEHPEVFQEVYDAVKKNYIVANDALS